MADYITYVGRSEGVNDAGLTANAYQRLDIPFPAGIQDGDLLVVHHWGLNHGGGTQAPGYADSLTWTTITSGRFHYATYDSALAGPNITISSAFNLGPSNHYYGTCHAFRSASTDGTWVINGLLSTNETGENWTPPGINSPNYVNAYTDYVDGVGSYAASNAINVGSIPFILGQHGAVMRFVYHSIAVSRNAIGAGFANGRWHHPDTTVFTAQDFTDSMAVTLDAAPALWTSDVQDTGLVVPTADWGDGTANYRYEGRPYWKYLGAWNDGDADISDVISPNFTESHLGNSGKWSGPLHFDAGHFQASNQRSWQGNLLGGKSAIIYWYPNDPDWTDFIHEDAEPIEGSTPLESGARRVNIQELPYQVRSQMLRSRK